MLRRYFNPIRFLISNNYKTVKHVKSTLFSYKFDNDKLIPEYINDPVIKFVSRILGYLETNEIKFHKIDDKYNLVYPIGTIPVHHMLRIMDQLIFEGYEIIRLHDKKNPYTDYDTLEQQYVDQIFDSPKYSMKHVLDIIHLNEHVLSIYMNNVTKTYKIYKIMNHDNILLNDLFDDYNKLNSLFIQVDDEQLYVDSEHLDARTYTFIKQQSKEYNSLVNGISILNDEYGYGIKVYSECPIYNFLMEEGCEINYSDAKGTIRWNGLLNPTGFS